MAETNPWNWWQRKLAGEKLVATLNDPQPGFYRWVRKDKYGGKKYATHVAFYPKNGAVHCRTNGVDVPLERGNELWNSVNDDPVPEAWYREVAEQVPPAKQWHDGLPLWPQPGDNEPPEDLSFAGLRDKIENLAREAKERLKGGPIEDEAEASRVGILAETLSDLWKIADEKRAEEKRPSDDESKRIQKKWAPLLFNAETYRNLKYKLLTPWAIKVKDKLKQQAVEAAIAGEPPPEEKKAKINTRGRAMSLRPSKRAEIVDYAACLEFFRENAQVKLTVQDLANKAVRADITVPGTKVIEEEQVV